MCVILSFILSVIHSSQIFLKRVRHAPACRNASVTDLNRIEPKSPSVLVSNPVFCRKGNSLLVALIKKWDRTKGRVFTVMLENPTRNKNNKVKTNCIKDSYSVNYLLNICKYFPVHLSLILLQLSWKTFMMLQSEKLSNC